MICRIDPPIPLNTSRGSGLAHFLIDYGAEHHLLWVVFLDSDGSCWTLPNTDIRGQQNETMGRT